MRRLIKLSKIPFQIAIGLWLLLLSGGAFTFLPEELPYFDHLPEIDRLIASGNCHEAQTLAGDVLDTGEYPAEAFIQLESRKNYCTKVLESHPATDFLLGFATGDSSTLWSGTGSIAGDLLIWGDIRDLAIQGIKSLTGKETDPVLVSLSALGLALEITPAADILSSILKSLRKAGSLPGFIAKNIVSADGKKFFGKLAQLFKHTGRGRFPAIAKQVKSADELELLTSAAKTDPARLHLAMYSAKDETLAALKNAPDNAAQKRILKLAPRGKSAFKLVRRHRLTALAKITASGRLNQFFRQLALAHPKIKYFMLGAGAFLVILGCVNAGKSFFPPGKR